MIEKIRTATKQVHWSLALKAAIFAFSWYLLSQISWLVFLLIAAYLYFFPSFRSLKLLFPFAVLLVLVLISPVSLWLTLVFGLAFFLILGTKELILVDRRTAFQSISLIILFVSFLNFFSRFDAWEGRGPVFLWALIPAALFLVLMRQDLKQETLPMADNASPKPPFGTMPVLCVFSFALWQISLAMLFLPLTFLSQTALLFCAAASLFEIIPAYVEGHLTKRHFMTVSSIFMVAVTVILVSAQWGY
jgi:hypothetical protein